MTMTMNLPKYDHQTGRLTASVPVRESSDGRLEYYSGRDRCWRALPQELVGDVRTTRR